MVDTKGYQKGGGKVFLRSVKEIVWWKSDNKPFFYFNRAFRKSQNIGKRKIGTLLGRGKKISNFGGCRKSWLIFLV